MPKKENLIRWLKRELENEYNTPTNRAAITYVIVVLESMSIDEYAFLCLAWTKAPAAYWLYQDKAKGEHQ